jgi:SAM-dependent methyltransferase
MKMKSQVACTVCGSQRFSMLCSAEEIEAHRHYLEWFHGRRLKPTASPRALADRADFTQDYATNIVQCQECGLLMRHPRPSAYQTEQKYAEDTYGAERLQALYDAQVELFRPKARALQSLLRPGMRVIEVGCFVGGFLKAGQEQGWEMLGIDPGEEVTAFCQRQHLPVCRGTLEEARIPAGTADAVTIWNTFDQLPDPKPALIEVQKVLRPGGLLLLRIPNGACFARCMAWERRLQHRLWRRVRGWLHCALAWNNLLAFPYLYGYSLSNLDRLLAKYGLHRLRAEPDVLVRLSDENTRAWAVREERMVKAMLRAASRFPFCRQDSSFLLAPWLDVLYRAA